MVLFVLLFFVFLGVLCGGTFVVVGLKTVISWIADGVKCIVDSVRGK